MKKHILQAYRVLSKVADDGAYMNMAFYGEDVSDMATLLVYGVLENEIRIDYILSSFIDKKPQKSVLELLRIGVYALENLTSVPKFAIVSECVEAAKAIGKGGAGGFINAVLKKIANGAYALPKEDDENYLSVTYSKPQWFVDKLIAQYGKDVAFDIISAKPSRLEHARINSRLTNLNEVHESLKDEGAAISETGGIVLRASDSSKRLFDGGFITYQSPSSMLAVQAIGLKKSDTVLDICSAPGGKAVYASELCREVVACEIHPHRIGLIKKYADRMRAKNVKPVQWDATLLNEAWLDKFDCVIADVPCSCFGTFLKHPDVFKTRGEQEIYKLAETQISILKNAARYLKRGGTLVYSTCTLFDEENSATVDKLLKDGGFALEKIDAFDKIEGGRYAANDGRVQILPHGNYDGFYIAKLRRL